MYTKELNIDFTKLEATCNVGQKLEKKYDLSLQ